MSDDAAFRDAIRRRAIVFEIGGFRPPNDPRASWFGHVGLARPGESWPEGQVALAQVNLTELPFRPPRLDDVDMLTVFVDPESNFMDGGWTLRAYKSIDALVPIEGPDSPIQRFPMRPRVIEADFPCPEDLPDSVLDEYDEDSYDEEYENHGGFKLGGWPSLIQSEVEWPRPADYVFQIDSDSKAHWMWGDAGVGYFGRGTEPGREDEWLLEWQCC